MEDHNISWKDPLFIGACSITFATGIGACFVPQLLVTRPFFFGLLASLLTHKLLGGVGTGEITDFKTAVGNIKVSGPIAVLFFSIFALQAMFSLGEKDRKYVSEPLENELIVFKKGEGKGSDVKITNSLNKDTIYKLDQDEKSSLFGYFIDRCYLDKISGCKKSTNFIVNDELASPGRATICKGNITGVKITLSNPNFSGKSLGRLPTAVSLFANSSCDYVENTIYISSRDALQAGIKLDSEKKGEGYISPYLGDPILPEKEEKE